MQAELMEALKMKRKNRRELKELEALEKDLRRLVKPDEKLLAQIAARRRELVGA